MRPLLCDLQYRNIGKCRHLYRFTKIPRNSSPQALKFPMYAQQRTIRLFRPTHPLFT